MLMVISCTWFAHTGMLRLREPEPIDAARIDECV